MHFSPANKSILKKINYKFNLFTKLKTSLLLTIFGLVSVFVTLHAQETIAATGGESSGTGGTASYTIGQIVYTTATGANGSVSQGVQQPYEISVTLGVEVKSISLNLSIYPNPTANYLTLKIGNNEFPLLSYYLFDIQGKLIEKNKTTGRSTIINMTNLSSSTYFLRIMDTQKTVKTFKIIKN